MKLYNKVLAVAASALMLVSCDFLDVAPAERTTFKDAMKTMASTEGWLYGCFNSVAGTNGAGCEGYEGGADEYTTPVLWSEYDNWKVRMASINATNISDSYWRVLYGDIGNVHLFLKQLDILKPDFLTEEDIAGFKAQINFIKAYYYFRILQYFGPCPIVYEYADMSTTKDQYAGRSHYDYVVQYILSLLEEAYPNLPATYSMDKYYGQGNQVIAAFLKAKVLLYAASPLWNGDFPWLEWKNKVETPGTDPITGETYGYDLVSRTFHIEKWYAARDAAVEAIRVAEGQGGRELFTWKHAEPLIAQNQVEWDPREGGCWYPGVDPSTPQGEQFYKAVLTMRYAAAADEGQGNKEIIWSNHTTPNQRTFKPRNMIYAGSGDSWSGGWSGGSVTLNAVEKFYTANGKLPKDDPNFTPEEDWFKSAGLKREAADWLSDAAHDRSEIINLHVNREPRFYAWINFDGGEMGPKLGAGKPKKLNLRSSARDNADPYTIYSGTDLDQAARDNNQSGYLSDKFCTPAQQWAATGSYSYTTFLFQMFRLADLYLFAAEAYAEIYMHEGGDQNLASALQYLNPIRERAGIAPLTTADCTSSMTIRDWVRNERFVELFQEGHRWHDIRRWVVGDQYLGAGKLEGLQCFVNYKKNASVEHFNQRVKLDGDFKWMDRLYMLPINLDELYSNPQMVQAPGY